MKRLLLLCLVLTGCAGNYTGGELKQMQALCEHHGGVARIPSVWRGPDTLVVLCKDRSEITAPSVRAKR